MKKSNQKPADCAFPKEKFKDKAVFFKQFRAHAFHALAETEKREQVHRSLLELIQKERSSGFLLIAVLDYIHDLHLEKIFENYLFSHFELWLNQNAGLSAEENLKVRGKIAGKYIPRVDYQVLFPVGMGKMYAGSHFVTAHSSPDIDTIVASFWGWLDAFSCRVSEGLHFWNVPGGAPEAIVEIDLLFYEIFGVNVFEALAKTRSALTVSGMDLVSQSNVIKKEPQDLTLGMDLEQTSRAVIIVDEEGYYLGEWRGVDVERVRFVITLLNQCLRWYENNLHAKLIAFFAKKEILEKDLEGLIHFIFKMKIKECEPLQEFTLTQQRLLQDYLSKVLGVQGGIESTIAEFAKAMRKLQLGDFENFLEKLENYKKASLFDKNGKLVEDRSKIFNFLEKVIGSLNQAIHSIRIYVERLDVAQHVKTQVLGMMPAHVNLRADLEELHDKMQGTPYLTVTYAGQGSKLVPMGVVSAEDLYKSTLGTVTLRDFSNREETKIPPYLEVISVVDHHKSVMVSSMPAVVTTADVQSCNTLLAELSFKMNDAYSSCGMTASEIIKQMDRGQKKLETPSQIRVFQKLLQRKQVVQKKDDYFVSPQREMIEYSHFLYAILDDTDLLTKVTARDVEVVVSLLNRLKSLALREEVEVIHLDDIPRDAQFAKNAAKKILQNEEMYNLYQKEYQAKEEMVDKHLKLCVQGRPSSVFADTKEQNGCCRVGQTKIFARNWPLYEKHASAIQKIWVSEASAIYAQKKEIDLYLHMMSTMSAADELYQGKMKEYRHQDELWIWIPPTEAGQEHLRSFLSAFKISPQVSSQKVEVVFLGKNRKELEEVFQESFGQIKKSAKNENIPMAILRFKAGTINSRKAMISPYLPQARASQTVA